MSTMASQITSLTIFAQWLVQAQIKKTLNSTSLVFGEGNSPVTGEFPAQRASDTEYVSIGWRHNENNLNFLIYHVHVYML